LIFKIGIIKHKCAENSHTDKQKLTESIFAVNPHCHKERAYNQENICEEKFFIFNTVISEIPERKK
jgi:hypothetical protein